MGNIETFPSKKIYLYLSLDERKVAKLYHNMDLLLLRWIIFITIWRELIVSLFGSLVRKKSLLLLGFSNLCRSILIIDGYVGNGRSHNKVVSLPRPITGSVHISCDTKYDVGIILDLSQTVNDIAAQFQATLRWIGIVEYHQSEMWLIKTAFTTKG